MVPRWAPRTGAVMFSPHWTISNRAAALCLRLETALGITPQERRKITLPKRRNGVAPVAALKYLGRTPGVVS